MYAMDSRKVLEMSCLTELIQLKNLSAKVSNEEVEVFRLMLAS